MRKSMLLGGMIPAFLILYPVAACVEVACQPLPLYEPDSFLDPIHAAPGEPLAEILKITNIGDAPLTIFQIDAVYLDGDSWIQFGTPTENPIPPGGFALVDVIFNWDGSLTFDPSGWDAWITVSHDDPIVTDSLPVHLTVASDFDMPQNDTLFATTKKLMVYNTGRIGGNNGGAALGIPGDCDEADETLNVDLYLYDASPMIAWEEDGERMIYTTVYDQTFTESGTFRPQSDLIIESFPGEGYNKLTCTLATADSVFGVGVEVWAPIDGNDFVIIRYDFTTWKPGLKGMDHVFVGMYADWDIPSDENSRNSSGFYEPLYAVWQRGVESNDADENQGCPIVENQRYGGIVILSEEMKNFWTGKSAPVRQGSGLNPDSMYDRMSGTEGYDMYYGTDEDSVADLYTGITFAEVDMTAKATYTYGVALITSNVDLTDLLVQATTARLWAGIDFCWCLPGDPNGDWSFNVSDAVYLIAYIFKGGPPPQPYATCSGDPNGDCAVGIGDAVYMINYVFKGGPPPASCREWRDGNGIYLNGCGHLH